MGFDNCVGVLVICILVLTVFCIVCTVFFFVLFRLCISILICFVCTSVKTSATEWQLNCSLVLIIIVVIIIIIIIINIKDIWRYVLMLPATEICHWITLLEWVYYAVGIAELVHAIRNTRYLYGNNKENALLRFSGKAFYIYIVDGLLYLYSWWRQHTRHNATSE